MFGVFSALQVQQPATNIGLVCIFCGLYFGVTGRDCAELAADFMASSIGFTRAQEKYYDGSRCAICAQDFKDPEASESISLEPVVTLGCNHKFHELCIRGWAMV